MHGVLYKQNDEKKSFKLKLMVSGIKKKNWKTFFAILANANSGKEITRQQISAQSIMITVKFSMISHKI